MMHDFNSVSGMWSEIQLKGRGGRRGGEGTNVDGIKRERGEEGGRRGERGGGGCIPPLSPLVRGFLDRARASGEGRERWRVEERRRGMEGRGGAGVAFVCFPRFKASLEK